MPPARFLREVLTVKEQMTAPERFYNLVRGKSFDRLPIMEWAPWWGVTVERWQKEGMALPYDVYQIQDYFGLDKCLQTGFGVRTAATPVAKSFGAGILTDEAGYEEIKKTMFPEPATMLPPEHFDWCRKTRAKGDALHFFTVEGFFWYPRELFGIENHLYSFYDEPELLHRMCDDYAEWLLRVFAYIGETFHYDFMSFSEDMSYNNGPMIGKETFDEFLAPYYKKVIPALKELDIPIFIDSDGDITRAVDWYAGVGAEGMFPLERQAGVDVSLYVEKQPGMTYLGHFDKMCMKFGEAAMRAEFERILPSCIKGKVIPSVDHQTPPDVSLENYKTYVRLFHEYAEKVRK